MFFKYNKYIVGWHKCFLWLPTRISDKEIAWLTTVERHFDYNFYPTAKYRKIKE